MTPMLKSWRLDRSFRETRAVSLAFPASALASHMCPIGGRKINRRKMFTQHRVSNRIPKEEGAVQSPALTGFYWPGWSHVRKYGHQDSLNLNTNLKDNNLTHTSTEFLLLLHIMCLPMEVSCRSGKCSVNTCVWSTTTYISGCKVIHRHSDLSTSLL